MYISFENQVALVTGAASGIGLATAKAFAQSGASVALADWNEKAVRSAAEELAGQGHKTLAIRCDVADDAQVEAMVDQTVAAFGRLDAAYNNAGVQNELAEAADQTREDFDRVVGINLRGVWSCMKFELRQMRKQGSGTIVNCSSLGGLVGSPERGIYHAAKHGVLGFTKSAALEYAARGIRINAICPGLIQTPMSDQMVAAGQGEALKEMEKSIPMGRVGRPEEIANAVLWLCSDAASYVTGQSISVDGGFIMRGRKEGQAGIMTSWSEDELRKIIEADDLHIAPFRDDGVTYGTPTWIWSVAVDGAVYLRGYNGQKSRWYQAAVRQRAGRIIAAGTTKEVTFESVTGAINDRIDDAYRAKYRGSTYLNPMVSARARSATVKVMLRE